MRSWVNIEWGSGSFGPRGWKSKTEDKWSKRRLDCKSRMASREKRRGNGFFRMRWSAEKMPPTDDFVPRPFSTLSLCLPWCIRLSVCLCLSGSVYRCVSFSVALLVSPSISLCLSIHVRLPLSFRLSLFVYTSLPVSLTLSLYVSA